MVNTTRKKNNNKSVIIKWLSPNLSDTWPLSKPNLLVGHMSLICGMVEIKWGGCVVEIETTINTGKLQ